MNGIDSLPYKTFNRLKKKYPVKTLVFRDADMLAPGIHLVYKNHREYIDAMFKKEVLEVYRWHHNYNSLDGANPELGLVYLMNDSVISPGMEVHALIGHNVRALVTP